MAKQNRMWVVALLAIGIGSGAQAREGMPQRRAEVIGVDGATWAGEGASTRQADEMREVFRVHDLSRSWAEDEMREALREGATARSGPQGPPSIVVPSWMRFSAPVPWSGTEACGSAIYRPSGLLDFAGEARRRSIFAQVHAAACARGIPTPLLDALIIQESRYQPTVVSPKRAYGYTQLMPGTAQAMGVDRFDPIDNLHGGARYLRDQLDRYGRVELALAAYNAGPGRVADKVPAIAETRDYVVRVLRNWRVLGGLTAVGEATSDYPGEASHSPPVSSAMLLSF